MMQFSRVRDMTQQPMTLEQILAKVNQRIASLEELQRDLSEDGKYGWLMGIDAYIYAPSQHCQDNMLANYGIWADYVHPDVNALFNHGEETVAQKNVQAELDHFRELKRLTENKIAETKQIESDYQRTVEKIKEVIGQFVNKHCLDERPYPEAYGRLCAVGELLKTI
jgi:hypothetical protein